MIMKHPFAYASVAAMLMAPTLAAHGEVRVGAAAVGDWRDDAPGVVRRIGPGDMPAPYASHPSAYPPAVVARPDGARPKAPPGFSVGAFARLDHPRQIRVAPNGDIFVAETDVGRVSVLRARDGAASPLASQVFAANLDHPFGIAFYPKGPNPRFVYIANNNAIVRFAYANGDMKARREPESVVARIAATTGGHTTRDVEFTADDTRMLVSVGSSSNLAEGMAPKTLADSRSWEALHARGAAWGRDEDRADVLSFNVNGGDKRIYATGIRNCVTLRVSAVTGAPWCAVNERDSLGDDLPPDYVSRIKPGGFYGWPWFYIGAHEDPRKKGQRPDLASDVVTPDVLIQPHSAPLGLTFYTARQGVAAFPASWRGDAFVALHGSWNRAKRTGYKIVRLKVVNGAPTGTYEDFVTGFVVDDRGVWGRPVGVAVAHDGALLFTDDASNTLWRVAYVGSNGKDSR